MADRRLEAVAGAPVGALWGLGSVTLVTPIAPDGDVTTVGVVDTITTEGDWSQVVGLVLSNGDINAKWSFGPSGGGWRRYGGGWNQHWIGGRTVGRHVIVMRRSGAYLHGWVDGKPTGETATSRPASYETLPFTGVFGWRAYAAPNSAIESPLFAGVWDRALSQVEVTRLMVWLAGRYGIPLTGVGG